MFNDIRIEFLISYMNFLRVKGISNFKTEEDRAFLLIQKLMNKNVCQPRDSSDNRIIFSYRMYSDDDTGWSVIKIYIK